MSPLQRSNNLAARMGRWSASHWKTAVFGWLAFVLATVAIGQAVGTKNIDQQDSNVGQAHKADKILKDAGFQFDPQTEIVLVQSKTKTFTDVAFQRTVNDVRAAVTPFRTIKNFRSPLDPAHADQVSKDGRTALVEWDMRGDDKAATDNIDPILAATDKVAKAHPNFYVGEAGSISSGKALDKMFTKQLEQAGTRSVPLTLLVLVIVFGALVAAGVPLLLALSAVMATIGLVALPSHLIPMDKNVSAVILLIGLAVGVDYSLFYGDKTFMGFGVATMLVVGVAMLGSLTVLPALLAKLGDRVEKGRIPFLGRLRRRSGENRFWSAILTPALRHPVWSGLAAAAVPPPLAPPVPRVHTPP